MATGKRLILATIIDVLPGQVTYPACVTCYTKLHHLSISNKFQCQRCGKLYEVSEVHHRYRLAIKVTNQSVCREVTVFGSCLDPFFGSDATTFSRYIQHASQHHQTACNDLDLLNSSVKSTLVGHPFYFGFKTAGNFFVWNNDYTDSCVPLANIVARDSENLVAVQMTSPFQRLNFPTVVQNLFKIISNQKSLPFEKEECVQCSSDDGFDVCPFIAISLNQNEGEKVENDQDTNDHSEEREVNRREVLDRTSSRRDATCDESCGASSVLGETFFSCSIPSFRLSCDKSVSTINKALCSRLSGDSIHPGQSCLSNDTAIKPDAEFVQCVAHIGSRNLLICTSDANVNDQGTSIHESRSVQNNVSSTGKACADLTLPEHLSKGDLTEGSYGQRALISDSHIATVDNADDEHVVHSLKESTQIEEIPVDTSDICSRNKGADMTIDLRTKGHGQDGVDIHDSSIIQECEQYMNEWLEENSFDRWSYHESIPNFSATHRESQCHGDEAAKGVPPCHKEDRQVDKANRSSHPDLSHASACRHDFPDDLPFSEDLDQFLDDVEEEYAQSRKREASAFSHRSRRHRVKNQSIGTDCSDKDPATFSKCRKSSNPEGETSNTGAECAKLRYPSERTEGAVNSSTCTTARTQSYDNFKLKEGCHVNRSLSASSLGDPETDVSYVKAKDCTNNQSLMQHSKCNDKKLTAHKEGKEQERTSQSTRDELHDLNTTGEKQVDESICDADSVISKTSLQNERTSLNCCSVGEVERASTWCEDCSQSPLLFSQSQSPILPARSSVYPTSPHPRSENLQRSCRNDADNLLPFQHKSTPQLRLEFNRSGQKPDRRANTPNDQVSQRSYFEKSPKDLHSPDQGTPCLFSQVPDDRGIPSWQSFIPVSRNSRRPCRSRQKATPLRQLFLQRARSWKMSSTPMTAKKNTTVERSFESPLSCGTPDLFSTENSPDVGDTSGNHGQENHSRESFLREVSGSLEYTPDLF